jgi:uncharacterized protein YdeI (YjbR/CyaY-like superfamily)
VSVVFFATPAEFRAWLEQNHTTEPELVVGFRKRSTGRPSMTWKESVDAALCFGWIDGVRRGIDDDSYSIRFTPRRRGSIWSAVNVARFTELEAAGLVVEAGRVAFAARREDRTAVYSHERSSPPELTPEDQARFEADTEAWAWFSAQPPSYRRQALHWVTSAKQEATRQRRLDALIADSRAGLRVKPLRWNKGSSSSSG